jgi:hypothetical protein
MNIGKFDIGVLFILSLAVVVISFTGPVFGLTNADATNESQIPNLSVGEDSFDIAGDFPEQPGNPSGGVLNRTENVTAKQGVSRQFITGSYQNTNGVELILDYNFQSETEARLFVYDWGNGAIVSIFEKNLTEGETYRYENQTQGVVVETELVKFDNDYDGKGNQTAELRYSVEQTPSDNGVFRNLPIVGGIVSGASALPSIVGWIGSIIFYYLLTAAEVVINAVVMLFDVTSYLFSMVSWLFGTYLQVVDGAPGWASVIVALPGVLFAAILSKFVAVGISLLPTT